MGVQSTFCKYILLFIVIVAMFTSSSRASAAIIYSFSDIQLTDGIQGDPLLTVSGSLAIPKQEKSPVSNNPSDWSVPLGADFTVTKNGKVFQTLTDPSIFSYNAGINGSIYELSLSGNVSGHHDALGDFLGLTIFGDTITSIDFANLNTIAVITSRELRRLQFYRQSRCRER